MLLLLLFCGFVLEIMHVYSGKRCQRFAWKYSKVGIERLAYWPIRVNLKLGTECIGSQSVNLWGKNADFVRMMPAFEAWGETRHL